MKTKSFFLNLNVYEVVYDLIILSYIVVVYKIFAKDSFLISRMNEIQLAIFILMIDIAVPFYLGKIYKNYKTNIKNEFILKFILILFTFITFWLFFVIPITLYNKNYIQSEYVIGIILGGGVINIITGYLVVVIGRKALLLPIIIGISLVIFYISLWFGIDLFGDNYGAMIGFLFLFPFIILLLGIIGSVFYYLIDELKLEKKFNWEQMDSYIKNISTIILAFLLCLWDEMYFKIVIKKLTGLKKFYYLFFTGVLPLRIIIMFEPSIRIKNIIIGLIVLTLLFLSR